MDGCLGWWVCMREFKVVFVYKCAGEGVLF